MADDPSDKPRQGGGIPLSLLLEVLEEEGFDFETMDVLQPSFDAHSPRPAQRKPGQVPPPSPDALESLNRPRRK